MSTTAHAIADETAMADSQPLATASRRTRGRESDERDGRSIHPIVNCSRSAPSRR
jgi:hypothetical protein